ncbi:aldehyde dehydrogenase [Paraburkholderia phytofirmans]
MQLGCEDTFGPVLPVFRFDGEAEAIAGRARDGACCREEPRRSLHR